MLKQHTDARQIIALAKPLSHKYLVNFKIILYNLFILNFYQLTAYQKLPATTTNIHL